MPKRRLVSIIGVIIVGATVFACGHAPTTHARANSDAVLIAKARTSLTAGFQQSVVAAFPTILGGSNTECVANAMLTTIGLQRLIAQGVLNRDGSLKTAGASFLGLPMKDAQKLSVAFFGCVPMAPIIAAIRANIDRQLPPVVTARQETCLNVSITPAVVTRIFTVVFMGHPDQAFAELKSHIALVAQRCSRSPGVGT